MLEVILTGLLNMVMDPWKLILFGVVLAGLLLAISTKDMAAWGLVGAFIFFGILAFFIQGIPELSDRLSYGIYQIALFLSWGFPITEGLSFSVSDLLILATAAMQVSGAAPVDTLMGNIRSIAIAVIIIVVILVFI
jgi:type IV secretory pathway TrbL component